MKFSKNACDKKDTKACFHLALMHREGKKIQKDASKAVEFYTKSCELGYAFGCNILGNLYDKGEEIVELRL